MAEALAFGSLLMKERGATLVRTRFAERSAIVTRHLRTRSGRGMGTARQLSDRAKYEIYDSPLSEAGALGSNTATASGAFRAGVCGRLNSAISSTRLK